MGQLSRITMQYRSLLRHGLAWIAVLATAGVASAQSPEPAERFFFGPLFLGGDTDDSFVDRHPGNDMLPYTEDDFDLPPRGNSGGNWSCAHHDIDADGQISEDEHIFVVIRRGDDGTQNFSAMSHPELGVIYEAEDWWDWHDARNEGPSRICAESPELCGGGANPLDWEGNDFEHNDRPDWEGESNAYLFNNLRANQHGKNRPKYYFEHINAGSDAAAAEEFVYEEVEGYTKVLNFQHNMDDPDTQFNERGDCRREYMRTREAVTRGYLLPVEDLADLEDGSLPSLFGWEAEGFDLAAYLRDTIAPKLASDDLALYWDLLAGDEQSGLPLTHLMLLQIESPININEGDLCDPAQAQAMADYWGLPPEGAVYRVSELMGMSAEETEIFHGEGLRRWEHEPDGDPKNLWMLDHFFRDDPNVIGTYELIGIPATTWLIELDPGAGSIDQTANRVLAQSDTGTVVIPLPRPLSTENELPIEVVVDMATDTPDDVEIQIALLSGNDVVAQATLETTVSSCQVGGEFNSADGTIDGGQGDDGAGGIFGPLLFGEYTRYVLRLTDGRIDLYELTWDEYEPSNFFGLQDGMQISGFDYRGAGIELDSASIDRVAVRAEGSVSWSTFAVLAAPLGELTNGGDEPEFVRSDANADGLVDISDAIATLTFLFLGGEDLPCLDAVDADDSEALDITDAIVSLQAQFLGNFTIPPPSPGEIPDACGVDPTNEPAPGEDEPLDCQSYPPCEEAR